MDSGPQCTMAELLVLPEIGKLLTLFISVEEDQGIGMFPVPDPISLLYSKTAQPESNFISSCYNVTPLFAEVRENSHLLHQHLHSRSKQ